MKNLNFLLENIFRANASYKLVESGNLSRLEQQALTGLLSDPEVYGVFKPGATVSYDSYKVAYKDVALLWYSLQQPGTMPIFLKGTSICVFRTDRSEFLVDTLATTTTIPRESIDVTYSIIPSKEFTTLLASFTGRCDSAKSW